MNGKTRIILNTLATYGRTLFAIGLGLFTTRWVLEALGQVDFGLYGIIGSLLIFITFLNNVSGSGIARFYAYSIGKGRLGSHEYAIDDLMRWFNTALSVHFFFPILIAVVVYPLGFYAIKHWLVIPDERISACIWVLRIAICSTVVSMILQPFLSMYAAHQLITELAIFGVVSTLVSFVGAYILLNANCDRLITYAVIMGVSCAGVPIIQAIRAHFKFPACRIRLSYLFDWKMIKKLFGFSGWYLFGNIGAIARNQGVAVLVNLYFGPRVNAAFGVANQVSGQASSLSGALVGALTPAITTSEGAGRRSEMIDLAYRSCKLSTFLVLLFVIPLSLEINGVLSLWLKQVPRYANVFCVLMMILLVIDKLTIGHMMAINAEGRIGMYQAVMGFFALFTLPIGWILIMVTGTATSLCGAFLVTQLLCLGGRLYFCLRNVGMSPYIWMRKVLLPLIMMSIATGLAGLLVIEMAPGGFARICLTSFVTFCIAIVYAWRFVLDMRERSFLQRVCVTALGKFWKNSG